MAVQTQILHRRGTAATWTSTNPTLGAGEVGFETDTGKFKIGTGSAAWTALPYAAIDAALLAAKGDLVTATANDTPARLAVGNNGETLVADSSASTGLRWGNNYGFAAGKNKIINGDFGINQRNFASATTNQYTFDRWQFATSGATATCSAQTFTAGTAPVSGYEAKNFIRLAVTTGNDFCRIEQFIESVRTFANQTITVSFWAKGTNPTTAGNLKVYMAQYFGTGGSPSTQVDLTEQTFVLTANWTRYSFQFAVPSISGKTLGTNNNDYLSVIFGQGTSTSTDSWTLDLWGVQVEAGNTATAFQTATGTLQGELAACQRYYFRWTPTAAGQRFGLGLADSTTSALPSIPFPVPMRIAPTALDQSGTAADYGLRYQGGAVVDCSSVPTLGTVSPFNASPTFTVASGLTAGDAVIARAVTTSGYLGWSAEL